MRLIWSVALAVTGLCCTTAAMARIPKLAADARVRSVEFRFIGPHDLRAEDLEPAIATEAPGTMDRVTAATSWIPFVPDPEPHAFSATVLQQDLERLRRQLRRKGFLDADADYQVRVADNRRDVSVVFVVREGEPTRVRTLTLGDGANAGGALPDSLAAVCAETWKDVVRRQSGERNSDELTEDARRSLASAFGNAGYPWARFGVSSELDSSRREADVTWRVKSGVRARLGDIRVEGVHSVPEPLVVRQLGLQSGEWFSRRDLDQSRLQLQSVPLFQRSDVLVADSLSTDSSVAIRALIQESRARLTNLELGYVTDGAGVTSQARWTHPNLTGGARSFDAIALVQTGWGTTSDEADRLLRATLSLTQPYVASPRMSLSGGPAIERRDGRIDRSVSYSLVATLVYRFNALQSAALRYDYTYRRLEELHVPGLISAAIDTLGGVAGLSDAIIDSLKTPDRIPQLIFFTSLGHLDNFSRPRHGMVVKPNLALTIPASWGNVDFAKGDVQ
ncbi:MAG: POTRA domain-containing protein, partial [Candidatus Eiseniibacteriota bacterium]